MRLNVDTEQARRIRHQEPHFVFVLAKKFDADDVSQGAFWIVLKRCMRRWRSGSGYEYNIEGKWRSPWETFY